MKLIRGALAAGLMAVPGMALAHPQGGGDTFTAGLLHPLTGLDHLLAMVAVGLWAALCGGRALWALPVTFLAVMLAGFGLGTAGVALPAVEPVILGSVIVLGSALAVSLRLSLVPAVGLVALFGLAHGHAHGTEGPGAGLLAYAGGFGLSSAALVALGLALGVGMTRTGWPVAGRALGGMAALAGVGMAVA